MAVRTTIEIPTPLHNLLRRRAKQSGASMRSLVVQALEQTYRKYPKPKKGKRVTGPMITVRGKRGPAYPVDENPHDLVFS
jgi:hypothetical protein